MKTSPLVQQLLRTLGLHCPQSRTLGCVPGLRKASPGRSGRGGVSMEEEAQHTHIPGVLCFWFSGEGTALPPQPCSPSAPQHSHHSAQHPLHLVAGISLASRSLNDQSPLACSLWSGILELTISTKLFSEGTCFLPGIFCKPLPFPGSLVCVCSMQVASR